MTKFEEDLNKKMDLKEVPMYFTQSGCSITRKTYIETNWIFDNYKNWHSDEEFQAKEKEIKRLRKINHLYKKAKGNAERMAVNNGERLNQAQDEIASLKSQLQQQALPVVPECVAKDVKRLSLSTLADWNVAVSYISKETLEWLSTTGNINVFLGKSWTLCSLKINGYQVEKAQLFYLKNTLTHEYLYRKYKTSLGEQSYCKGTDGKPLDYCLFTLDEIESMNTGSYEQIEVAE